MDNINRLQAMESLQKIMEIEVGTGSIKNGSAIRLSLVREMRKGKVSSTRIDPSALGSIGIGFEKWQKN